MTKLLEVSGSNPFTPTTHMPRHTSDAASCYTKRMDWASRRRFIILVIIGAVVVTFFSIIAIATFYKAPSCTDGVQNQGEAGIDCGGSCAYLCTEQVRPPTVLFTKAISNGVGRIDIVASIENTNATAGAKNVPYTVALYGANHALIREIAGQLDLPPASTIPVLLTGVASGDQQSVQAFLTIASSAPKWFTASSASRVLPVVANTTIGGSASAPRIDAILMNASSGALINTQVVVFVHSNTGEVVAASKTVLPTIPAQGQAVATFTWNSAFSGIPAKIEVIPVVSLP